MKVIVTSADIQDYNGAVVLLDSIITELNDIIIMIGDGSYNKGYFRDYIDELTEIRLEIIKRSDKKGFQLLPWRWIVERTFAWLGKFRRLSKDYELLPKHSESFIYLAMVNIMIRRLARL